MITYFDSPIGLIELTATEKGIFSLYFKDERGEEESSKKLDKCKKQLDEYFACKRKVFTVPLDYHGSEFQKKVWNELLKIPYGQVISYHELALRLGSEKLIRAAGGANARNPVSILIPCHRVIGSDGNLTSYGGGLWRKQWLLDHEGAAFQQEMFLK